MLLSCKNFYEEIETFTPIEEKITSATVEGFQKAFGHESANSMKNIVYMLRSEKPVNRLKGESDILYIGQTKLTFRNRYFRHAKNFATTDANRMKYSHIIEEYGPIEISFAPFEKYGKNLLQAEGQLLWWYFQNHREYPPINYSKTNVRSDNPVLT